MAKIKMNVSVTVAETFKDFLITKRAKGLAEKTLASYEQHFSAISKHLDVNVPVEQLDKAALDAMIVSMCGAGLAANSIQSYTRTLKSYFSWCNAEGLTNLLLHQFNRELFMRRINVARQGRNRKTGCRLSRISDAVLRRLDKQKSSSINWWSSKYGACLITRSMRQPLFLCNAK